MVQGCPKKKDFSGCPPWVSACGGGASPNNRPHCQRHGKTGARLTLCCALHVASTFECRVAEKNLLCEGRQDRSYAALTGRFNRTRTVSAGTHSLRTGFFRNDASNALVPERDYFNGEARKSNRSAAYDSVAFARRVSTPAFTPEMEGDGDCARR